MKVTNRLRPRAGSPWLFAWVLFLIVPGGVARAQQAAPTPSLANNSAGTSIAPASAPSVDDRYRIGPGDVISVTVLDYAQLSSDAVKVDGNGMILLPLISGEIAAACRTEGELAKDIATRYLKYLQEPQVKVFVKEYQSQPVAVIGAVHAPGRFQLQRRVRLLELLTYVSGPAEQAGQSIQIIHAGSGPMCGATKGTEETLSSALVTLKLSETLRGQEDANPFVQPGDIITVPDAEQYYIVGNVAKPSAYPLKESVTLGQAIAMAGGALPDTNTHRVRIVRHSGQSNQTELFVDLKATAKQQTAQIRLEPNDIVEVPKSSGVMVGFKNAFRTMVPALATSLPLRVIY